MEKRKLKDYPDLSWNPHSRTIPELVERLCVVEVKLHGVCLPI